jgi:hypothetical protein
MTEAQPARNGPSSRQCSELYWSGSTLAARLGAGKESCAQKMAAATVFDIVNLIPGLMASPLKLPRER